MQSDQDGLKSEILEMRQVMVQQEAYAQEHVWPNWGLEIMADAGCGD